MAQAPYRRYRAQSIGEPVRAAAIDRELRRIDQGLLQQAEPMAVLQGVPDNFILDTIAKTLQNYGNGYEGNGFAGSLNDAAGTITLPVNGIYSVTAHCNGTQGNNVQSEAATLYMHVDYAAGGSNDLALSVFDISNNKTDDRCFNASVTTTFSGQDVLSLTLGATASLGTYTFISASFEVTLRTLGRQ